MVYYHGSLGENVAVKNNQAYPMLVQSMVFDEDKKSPAPFITTPPLFRLDGSQTSRIRIVRTGGEFPQDRENYSGYVLKEFHLRARINGQKVQSLKIHHLLYNFL